MKILQNHGTLEPSMQVKEKLLQQFVLLNFSKKKKKNQNSYLNQYY